MPMPIATAPLHLVRALWPALVEVQPPEEQAPEPTPWAMMLALKALRPWRLGGAMAREGADQAPQALEQ